MSEPAQHEGDTQGSISTKFCRQCGAKIQRDSRYCEVCGEKLDGAITVPVTPQSEVPQKCPQCGTQLPLVGWWWYDGKRICQRCAEDLRRVMLAPFEEEEKKRQKGMKERRKAVLLAVAVVGLVVLLVLSFAFLAPQELPSPLRGTPPVEVLYDQSGLAYEDAVYYHKIVLRNCGSETVRVVVKVKTQLDYYAKTSAPVEICAGCVVSVRLCALTDCAQPPATQTPEQRAAMIDFLSHPEYVRVEYA